MIAMEVALEGGKDNSMVLRTSCICHMEFDQIGVLYSSFALIANIMQRKCKYLIFMHSIYERKLVTFNEHSTQKHIIIICIQFILLYLITSDSIAYLCYFCALSDKVDTCIFVSVLSDKIALCDCSYWSGEYICLRRGICNQYMYLECSHYICYTYTCYIHNLFHDSKN